jgi:Icc protein
MNEPLVFVVPGDLHLTEAARENHRAALWMVGEVSDYIRPDFVQFIGDNVQNALEEEFALFNDLARRLTVPYHVLVGDHDVQGDAQAQGFRRFIGETYGASTMKGHRLVRLNTMEYQPLGMSLDQTRWFRGEVEAAAGRGEKVVLFQHHYPFKVYEQFFGPGICAWKETVRNWPLAAIFTGHTHYGQIANDGQNLSITTRSIGDPEGGPPGFTLALLQGDDLAVTYRAINDRGPLVLITHPRDLLLATGPNHIVSVDDLAIVRVWSRSPIIDVGASIDGRDHLPLKRTSLAEWTCSLPASSLAKGRHRLEVVATDNQGQRGTNAITFLVDPTRRYTPVPCAFPEVTATAFC